MNKLRKLRVLLASLFLVVATLLFLDFTGTIHQWFGWVAKVQFIPALLALNVGVVLVLVALTLIFGRLYCSVICPLGVFQDVVSRVASAFNSKRKYNYAPAICWLRLSVLGLFIVAFVAGIGSIVALLEPYSAFGRMANNLFAPIYKLGNNALAFFAERAGSYAFYSTEVVIMSVGAFVVAALTFIIIGRLAWTKGRTYCNSICPVGTILGFLSRFSFLQIQVDEQKCNGCRKCVRTCKSSCITPETRAIDYSRCVVCFDCIDSCNQGAISYTRRKKATKQASCGCKTESSAEPKQEEQVDSSKRNMLAISATLLASSTLKGQEKLVDGGYAFIEDKKIPERQTQILPPGAYSIRRFAQRCTGCQLCVSVCENHVLRPAKGIMNFLQPEMSYEQGYCRPECTKCSEVCPVGAIEPIDLADKSSTQIGHAVWVEKNCLIATTDNRECGNCAEHCPVNAIAMIKPADERYGKRAIPVVDTQRCIGCGACEYLCPSRPFSAIYVEGHAMHKTV